MELIHELFEKCETLLRYESIAVRIVLGCEELSLSILVKL